MSSPIRLGPIRNVQLAGIADEIDLERGFEIGRGQHALEPCERSTVVIAIYLRIADGDRRDEEKKNRALLGHRKLLVDRWLVRWVREPPDSGTTAELFSKYAECCGFQAGMNVDRAAEEEVIGAGASARAR